MKTYLERLDLEMLPHPSYSPDIAPSDYYLFRLMFHALAEKRFQSFEDIKTWVNSWIASKDEEFFRKGIRKLPEKWRYVSFEQRKNPKNQFKYPIYKVFRAFKVTRPMWDHLRVPVYYMKFHMKIVFHDTMAGSFK